MPSSYCWHFAFVSFAFLRRLCGRWLRSLVQRWVCSFVLTRFRVLSDLILLFVFCGDLRCAVLWAVFDFTCQFLPWLQQSCYEDVSCLLLFSGCCFHGTSLLPCCSSFWTLPLFLFAVSLVWYASS